ncbi:ROK family protein [Ligilactobacillus animalis]|uniref:ROK family protein n=2 Tax=Ligilactobacillus animalis TaxID=1605 RepID=A0AAJ6FV41_9LACO|nr:ROK family protein [Ligilactobacillus animalis]WHQ80357.1 ROK family protein [Ligilactobacillus animalis]
MENLILIDIGGTTIKFGIKQGPNLEVLPAKPTPKMLAEFYTCLEAVVASLKKQYPIQGVAISSPGAVDQKTGVIKGASALPYIHNFKIQAELEKRFDLPVSLENDANCAALAEMVDGAGKAVKDAIFLVIGTGVGGALVENKRIRHGAHLLAGEVGYLLLGQEMTVSQAVSPVSLAKRYNTKTGRNISGKEVFERAQAGDEVAQAEVEQAMQTLATLLYDLQYSFDPELFIIGGAISKNEQLLPLLRAHLAKIKEHVEIADVMPEITVCKYHEQANLLGAAINFEHKMEA